MMNKHPPTHQTYPKCYCVTVHILWRVHGVGDGVVVGVFMKWVVGWVCVMVCMVRWVLESSWVGEYIHPPHPGVLGVMGGCGHDGWVGMGMLGRWVV